MAWCGQEVKAKVCDPFLHAKGEKADPRSTPQVFVIASTDLISSSYKTKEPKLPPGDPAELVQGWNASSGPSLALGDEVVDAFGAKVVNKGVLTATARTQASEVVPHKLVDAWISESLSSFHASAGAQPFLLQPRMEC